MSDTPAKITVREACRRRMALDEADAQALEHALTITERERDAAESEVARLREQVAKGERKLGTARALLPIQDGRPVSQGALNALLSQRDTAWDQLDEERATSARLRGLLREVEWNSGFWGDDSGCSICGAPKTSGHAIDCRLAAALEVGHG